MNNQEITFRIPGRPVPQERPLVLRKGWTVDRQKSRKAKQLVALIAMAARGKAKLSVSDGPFWVRAWFYGAHASADIDNLIKLLLDGLKGVFWKDDKQVTFLTAAKVYGVKDNKEYTDVSIWRMDS